jgi:hypothetical protein
VIGAEIGGAVKNVLAIACGVVEGAGLGLNARAALIARGFAEMTRFGLARGAQAETLTGLSGLGDLVLTCSSTNSRNFSLGLGLGRGRSAAELMADRKTVAEGAFTAPVLREAAAEAGIDMPVTEAVNALLEGADVRAVVEALAQPAAARGGGVKRWAALLRGVNLGGRKLLMTDLKAIAREPGLCWVETLLASGNVVFDAAESGPGIERRLEEALEKHGLKTDVMVRDLVELARRSPPIPIRKRRDRSPQPHAGELPPRSLSRGPDRNARQNPSRPGADAGDRARALCRLYQPAGHARFEAAPDDGQGEIPQDRHGAQLEHGRQAPRHAVSANNRAASSL